MNSTDIGPSGCAWGKWGKPSREGHAYIFWSAALLQLVISTAQLLLYPERRNVRISVTHGVLAVSSLLRATWLTLRNCGFDGIAEHFINRLSMLLLFSGFAIYLESWAALSLSRHKGSQKRRLLAVNAMFNGLVWALVLLLSIHHYASGADEDSHSYSLGIISVAVASVLVGILALSMGLTTFYTLRVAQAARRQLSSQPRTGEQQLRAATIKVVVVAGMCTVSFSSRCVCWLYQPITGRYTSKWTYPSLFYTIDLVPTLTLVIALFPFGELKDRALAKAVWTNQAAKTRRRAMRSERELFGTQRKVPSDDRRRLPDADSVREMAEKPAGEQMPSDQITEEDQEALRLSLEETAKLEEGLWRNSL